MQYWSERLRAALRLGRMGRIVDHKEGGGRGASARALWDLLMVLVDHANENGEVDFILLPTADGDRWQPHGVTSESLAACCMMSKRGVFTALNGLVAQGFIERGTNSGHPSGYYRVLWDSFGDLPQSTRAASTRATMAHPSDRNPCQPVTGETATRAMRSPENREAVPCGHRDPCPDVTSLPYRDPIRIGGSEERRGSDPEGSAKRPVQAPAGQHDDDPPVDDHKSVPPAPLTSPSAAMAPRSSQPQPDLASKVPEVTVIDSSAKPASSKSTRQKAIRKAEAEEVIEHWKRQPYHLDGSRLHATEPRRKRIAARLDEGFTVADLKLALSGAQFDDWLMGRAPRCNGKVFRDIDTILRDAAQVERLSDLAARSIAVTDTTDLQWAREFLVRAPKDPVTLRLRAERRPPRLWELDEMRRADAVLKVTPADGPRFGGHQVQRAALPGETPCWNPNAEVMQ